MKQKPMTYQYCQLLNNEMETFLVLTQLTLHPGQSSELCPTAGQYDVLQGGRDGVSQPQVSVQVREAAVEVPRLLIALPTPPGQRDVQLLGVRGQTVAAHSLPAVETRVTQTRHGLAFAGLLRGHLTTGKNSRQLLRAQLKIRRNSRLLLIGKFTSRRNS